jgi:hypothetical protein
LYLRLRADKSQVLVLLPLLVSFLQVNRWISLAQSLDVIPSNKIVVCRLGQGKGIRRTECRPDTPT